MGEFPLVFFTVLSQMAAGAAVTLALLDYFTDRVELAAGRKAALATAIITALSLGVSLLHLGTPLNAYRALTNLGSSWLSREVILFSLLLGLLAVYYWLWRQDNALRKTLGLVMAAVAVLAVISSALVYVLPAVPAWNNASTVAFFLLTAIVLGPLFILSVLKMPDEKMPSALINGTGLVLAAGLIIFLTYVSVLSSGTGASALTGANIAGSGAFWLRIVLNWVLPLGFLVWTLARRKPLAYSSVLGIFALVLAGELVGRYLFYYAAVALRVAGL